MERTEKNSKRGKRTSSRTYFHSGRNPEVLLLVDGRAYSGKLQDHSACGLGIELQSVGTSPLAVGDAVEQVFLGKTEPDFALRDLEIVHMNQQEKVLYLGLMTKNAEAQKRLSEVVVKLFQMESRKSDRVRGDRLPQPPSSKPHSREAMEARLEWLEKGGAIRLGHLRQSTLVPESLAGNIENYVGAVQIPVGIAGPILVKGTYVNGYVPVPIATTEGALVASISRGARVCSLAGGVRTHVYEQVMHRAPMFVCRDLDGAVNLAKWIGNHQMEIAAKAEAVSGVAKVRRLETFVHGRDVHVTFSYSTGDASGQNMTTGCTWHACEWIMEQLKIDESVRLERYFIEGNLSADKKAAIGNFFRGRGVSVFAEVYVPNKILETYLRTNSRQLADTFESVEVSSMRLGMMGCNINFANVIAGVFTATGQDIASVHESSMGILKVHDEGEGVRMSVYLPSLVIGTIGGGTGLPTQKEGLQIAGCYGAGNVFRLAEIIASTCLALDLSTGSAISANEFVRAHESLGRNRPNKYLSKSEINSHFFASMLGVHDELVVGASEAKMDSTHGISTNLLAKKRAGLSGIFRYDLALINENRQVEQQRCILKLKSSSDEMVNIGVGVAKLSGDDALPGLLDVNREIFGFEKGDVREIEIMKSGDSVFKKWLPKYYGSRVEPERALYALCMEDLSGTELLDSVNQPELWQEGHIMAVLSGLAEMHSVYLNRPKAIPESACVRHDDCSDLVDAKEFLWQLTVFNTGKKWGGPSKRLADEVLQYIGKIEKHVEFMKKSPSTLTHNDCNTRNLALRSVGRNQWRPVFFDWELAAWQNPQRDVVEFLCFVLCAKGSGQDFVSYVDFYHSELKRHCGEIGKNDVLARLVELNLLKFVAVRLNLYALVAPLSGFSFLQRVFDSAERNLTAIRK
jgi:NADP-dependent 3-hydroxy-3-methylglutaryl-CoA reductase